MKRRSRVRQLKRWARSEARIMGIKRIPNTFRNRISFGAGGPTEEGYHSVGITIETDTFIVTTVHDGRDCDGRLTRAYVNRFECLDRDHTAWVRRELGDEYRRAESAKWAELSQEQRDEYAELAGY